MDGCSTDYGGAVKGGLGCLKGKMIEEVREGKRMWTIAKTEKSSC
jgi:hypothetical protein